MSLLKNVHLALPELDEGETFLTRSDYFYHHYKCDGFNDVGWGCAYRTLQTICSMLRLKTGEKVAVPSIKEIQEILVRIGDKDKSFIGSRDWIGGAETCYVIDELFNVPCYLHHISKSERLSLKREQLVNYFKEQGGLVAMGGDEDSGSKLIAGVHTSEDSKMSLLVVDPHFSGSSPKDSTNLVNRNYIKWQSEDEFIDASFYNLCFPKLK